MHTIEDDVEVCNHCNDWSTGKMCKKRFCNVDILCGPTSACMLSGNTSADALWSDQMTQMSGAVHKSLLIHGPTKQKM